MKRLLTLALLLFAISAYTANWSKVFENNFRTSYVDIDRLTKHDEIVFFWTLTDYGEIISYPLIVNIMVIVWLKKNTPIFCLLP